MWLKERDRIINLDHVAVIEAYDTFMAVRFSGEEARRGVPYMVKEYGSAEEASKAVGDLGDLITEVNSIPFADNNVVFEV